MLGDSRVTRNPIKERLARNTASLAFDLLGPKAEAVTFPGLYPESHLKELNMFSKVWMYEADPKTHAIASKIAVVNLDNLYTNPPAFEGPTYHDLDGCQPYATMIKLGVYPYLSMQAKRPVNHFVNVVVPARTATKGITAAKQEESLRHLIYDTFKHHRIEKLESIKYGNPTSGHALMWIHQWFLEVW